MISSDNSGTMGQTGGEEAVVTDSLISSSTKINSNLSSVTSPTKEWMKMDETVKREDILEDTLFSVNSIMGQSNQGTWKVDAINDAEDESRVTLGQIRLHLRNAFEVSPETLDNILDKVQRRQVASVTLNLKVIEASDLRAKTFRGASNPYVTINIPGNEQNYRTKIKQETLNPEWDDEFKLTVKDVNEDIVKFEVWHHIDPKLTSQVLGVKDWTNISRLIKDTTAIAHKLEKHLLGSVLLPVKNIQKRGINDWFSITKEPFKDGEKQRGSLHIEACITANTQTNPLTEAMKSHNALLAQLICHHIKAVTNNNMEEDNVRIPWLGHISPEANVALAQHTLILGLNPALQNLSWWIVGSRVPTADPGWLLTQLTVVQRHLADDSYNATTIDTLADSFVRWINNNIKRLQTLKKSFPPDSGVIAEHQFSSTVAIFAALENHKESSDLLVQKEIKSLKNKVKEAVIAYMKTWWDKLFEQHLIGETQTEIQIQKIIIITSEVHDFLYEIQFFYTPVLFKEMSIKLFVEMFQLVMKKLKPCVQVPILNMYNHLESVSESQSDDTSDGKPSYILSDGSNLWQLYVNMGKINNLGAAMPVEIRKSSGIYEYHSWFTKGLKRWIELSRKRSLQMIEKAVEKDNLDYVHDYCNFSSSAKDVLGIFTEVQIWWNKLGWPDPEIRSALLPIILDDVCSYAVKYAVLLTQKVEALFNVETNTDQLVTLQHTCTGLNNIEKVRDELLSLSEDFGVHCLADEGTNSKTRAEDARRFSDNMKPLIENSLENIDDKIVDFIEAVIEEMTRTLQDAVIDACERCSEEHLLREVLDPSLQLLNEKMSENNFKSFVQILWQRFIELFRITVMKNKDKRRPSYFDGVHQILESSIKFFSPSDGVGIDTNEPTNQAYADLIGILDFQRLPTENLIAKYYSERYEKQKLATNNAHGELVVRAYFTKAGKLSIEIIMAKDMHLNPETRSITGELSQLGQINSYVKVQCVPSDWFPNIHEVKTKRMRRSDPAVFEETFECDMQPDSDGALSGFILFTLKDYNLGRPNTFIGEALIPLNELDCINSACVHSTQNIYLKVTQPEHEWDYASLKALALRSGDRVASSFLKKVQTRVQGRKGLTISDEEKPKASPSLLRKFMNN